VIVALLLVVCAANVATLLLVRANERASTLAVHAALGATRVAVAFQLLLEALLIAAGGGVVGLAIGYGMLHWMQRHLAQHWGYYWMRMEVRTPVIAATVVAVVVTAVIAGVAPAWRASRLNLSALLVSAGRGASSPRQRHLGRWFVAVQVAFSTIGLVAAAYIAWGASRMGLITSLLPMDEIALAHVTLPESYDATRSAEFTTKLRSELRSIPGISDVSIAAAAPGAGGASARVLLPGQDTSTAKQTTGYAGADAHLFDTYSMKVVMGRGITAEDERSGRHVAVVTPSFMRRHLNGSPIGQRIHLVGVHADGEWAEIVGVVNDWFPDQDGAARDRVFIPVNHVFTRDVWIAVRSTSHTNESVVLPGIRAAVARADHELPVSDLQTLHERMNWFMRMTRVIAAFAILGGVGSALVAAIGLYGVIAFQVRCTLREIGVRIALGSGSSRVMFSVVRESMIRVAPGLLAGMALGILAVPGLGRFVGGGTKPPSFLLLGAVVVGMLLIGIVAAIEPALRASRLSPLTVLRDG
jgi:predicted permease